VTNGVHRCIFAVLLASTCALAGPCACEPIAAFAQCAVCHSTDGSTGTGPTLRGVVGRKSGSLPGFRYSRAMRAAAILWDDKTLDRYLANPQGVVPGNIMPFSGVPDPAERAQLIAFLNTLK
jgi:cytochrome c